MSAALHSTRWASVWQAGQHHAGKMLVRLLWLSFPTPLQTLEHPSNLWGVAFLPNGDLVTACSDHIARVWTQATDRQAPAEVMQVQS
jgi:hypothetical protein